jgi:hypothetical protein
MHHGWVHRVPKLRERHAALFDSLIGDLDAVKDTELERALPGIGKLASVEADEEFWRVARAQFLAHPEAYARKWVLNVCRLLFDYPYTTKYQVDWGIVALHAVLLVVSGTAFVFAARGRTHVPPHLLAIGALTLLSTGLATALAAGVRYLLPLYPPVVLLALAGTAPERRRF